MRKRKQEVSSRRKYRVKWKRILFQFVTRGLLLGLLVWGVVFSGKKIYNYLRTIPIFQVRELGIEGADEVLERKLADFLKRNPHKDIFFSTRKLKNEILCQFPEVKEVSIKRRFNRKLSFVLEKRTPLATLRSESSEICQGIDGEGKIFPLSEVENLPLIPEKEDNLKRVIDFLYRLKAKNTWLYEQTKEISTSVDGDLLIFLNDGRKIIWGSSELKEETIGHLRTVMDDLNQRNVKVNSLDLRFFPEGGIIVETRKG